MTDKEKNEMLFIQIVSMFHGAALQQMGKLKNPLSDKIERDMQQAELSIDMLDMLKEKCKGNLSPDEEKYLSTILQELKLNFVDEQAKDANVSKTTHEAAQ
jgi:PIN domain nuclease of toxin-antitoxin system